MSRYLLFLFTLAFSTQSWAQLPHPDAAGVYCFTAGGPLRLSRLPMPGLQTQGLGEWLTGEDRFALRYTWDGASSRAQVSEHRPTFRVNLGYTPDRGLQIVQIVKLEQKSSYRKTELRFERGLPMEFLGGVAIDLTRGSDGELLVRPEGDLAAGEYMLSLGPLALQYDFSVR